MTFQFIPTLYKTRISKGANMSKPLKAGDCVPFHYVFSAIVAHLLDVCHHLKSNFMSYGHQYQIKTEYFMIAQVA